MKLHKIFLMLLLSFLSTSSYSSTKENKRLWDDLRSFAFASCLATQENKFLSQEGWIWANNINEGNVEFDLDIVLYPINEFVDKYLKEPGAYYIGFYEHSKDHTKTLQVATCFEFINKPSTEKFLRNIYKKVLKSR